MKNRISFHSKFWAFTACAALAAACNSPSGPQAGAAGSGISGDSSASAASLSQLDLNALGLAPAPAQQSAKISALSSSNISGIASNPNINKVEAEQMSLSGFTIVKNATAWGGAYIVAKDLTSVASFTSPFPSGDYLVVVMPFRSPVLAAPSGTMGADASVMLHGRYMEGASADDSQQSGTAGEMEGSDDGDGGGHDGGSGSSRVFVFRLQVNKGEVVQIHAHYAMQTIDYVAMIPMSGVPMPSPSVSGSPKPSPSVSASPSPSPSHSVSPSPSPSPSLSAATFTTVFSQVLQPKCLSCHGAGGAAGISYSNYAATLKTVVAGNASQSRLYTSISSGAMPPGGSVSAAQLQLIQSWINAGALNN